jgi:hypothetical protein
MSGRLDMTLMFAKHNALRRELEHVAKITARVDDDPDSLAARRRGRADRRDDAGFPAGTGTRGVPGPVAARLRRLGQMERDFGGEVAHNPARRTPS